MFVCPGKGGLLDGAEAYTLRLWLVPPPEYVVLCIYSTAWHLVIILVYSIVWFHARTTERGIRSEPVVCKRQRCIIYCRGA